MQKSCAQTYLDTNNPKLASILSLSFLLSGKLINNEICSCYGFLIPSIVFQQIIFYSNTTRWKRKKKGGCGKGTQGTATEDHRGIVHRYMDLHEKKMSNIT